VRWDIARLRRGVATKNMQSSGLIIPASRRHTSDMNYRPYFLCALALLFAGCCSAQDTGSIEKPDPQEIMRRSLAHWRSNLDAKKNYTYQERQVEQEIENDGDIKKTEIKTYDVLIIYGNRYEKLIAKDDKPLSEKDQQKEDEKLNKFFDKQKKKSDEDRKKEEAKEQEKFQREIADELPRMLTWELAGEDNISGQPTWILNATPRADYHPRSMGGRLLSKISGRVWISETDYQWVKAEATLADDFSVGWFLFKLHKGMHLEFEQTRINDEVWLPKRVFFNGSGRFAVKTGRFRNETTFSSYRKFSTDAKIIGVVEDAPAKPSPPQK
jgi:hypothetical protein